MNATFNIKRFLKLFQNEYYLNGKTLLSFIGVEIILTIIYFVILYLENAPENLIEFPERCFPVFIVGQLFVIQIHFSEFSFNKNSYFLFSLPASNTEKFMVKFMSSFIVYPLFILLYFIFIINLLDLYNHSFYPENLEHYNKLELVYSEIMDTDLLYIFLAVWALMSSIILLGTIAFHKNFLSKTIGYTLLTIFLIVALTFTINSIVFEELPQFFIPFVAISFDDFDERYALVMEYCPYIIQYILIFFSLICLIMAKLKFNERNI